MYVCKGGNVLDYFSIIGIAIGLSMDAFAVSVTNGAVTKNLKITYAIKLSVFFGFFQFAMPMAGWVVGKVGEAFISNVDHWVAFVLLSIIGGKMISDYRIEIAETKSPQKRNNLSNNAIFILAVATSIDALATGIILPSAVGASTSILMLISCFIIGIITFILSILGVYLGKAFGYFFSKHSQLFGGIVLIVIGIKILCEHLFL